MKKITDWLLYDWDGGFLLGVISGMIGAVIGMLMLFKP